MQPQLPIWGQSWHLGRTSYVELEAELTKQVGDAVCKKPVTASDLSI
jgi:hypothetical protein